MSARLTRLTRPLTQIRPSPQPHSRAFIQTTKIRCSSSSSSSNLPPFGTAPAPPRLPADQQAEFERLQRIANTQEGFNATSSPDFSDIKIAENTTKTKEDGKGEGEGDGGEGFVSNPLRKGAPPEFEGEVNPRTGEVGGPKNEPLRWGAKGDYSFNGRVTDF
ncbi:DUF1674-domain-containing protein [Poronia punctata]|nr:DUF1674-domain-containing protein [Poronia punctata]